MRAPRQGWPLAAALVAAFIVGAAIGAYGWSMRDRITAESDVNLVAGPVALLATSEGPLPAGSYQAVASIFNPEDTDVRVVDARLSGWTVTASQPITVVPAQGWASIPLTVAPNCDGVRPTSELALRLDSESGGQRIMVPIHAPSTETFGLHFLLCSEGGPGIRLLLDGLELTTDDGALDMRIPVHAAARGEPVTLVELDAATPGFRLSVDALPLRLGSGATETVSVRWTVEDCVAVEQLGDVQLTARRERAELTYTLPGRAVAALARLGVTSCLE